MTLSDHSLRQLDEESINSLPEDAVQTLAIKLLNDLKESREQLNRNSQNSSVPPGSEAPWDKGSKYCDEDQDDDDGNYSHPYAATGKAGTGKPARPAEMTVSK